MDADGDGERRTAGSRTHVVQLRHAGVHAARAAHGGRGATVVAVVEQAEDDEQPVAEELVDEASAAAHPGGEDGEELVEGRDQIAGRAPLGERGETTQVAEEHRRPPDLTAGLDLAGEQPIAYRGVDDASEGPKEAL